MPDPTFAIELNDTESFNIISALEESNRSMQSDIDCNLRAGSDTEATYKAWIEQNEAIIAKIKAGEATIANKLVTSEEG